LIGQKTLFNINHEAQPLAVDAAYLGSLVKKITKPFTGRINEIIIVPEQIWCAVLTCQPLRLPDLDELIIFTQYFKKGKGLTLKEYRESSFSVFYHFTPPSHLLLSHTLQHLCIVILTKQKI